MFRREADDVAAIVAANMFISGLERQLDRGRFAEAVGQILDGPAHQIPDGPTVHVGSRLEYLQLPGVDAHVDLALRH
jgi:hypothetical protein